MALSTTRRVNRREPCPVCGKPDWCRVAVSGRYAICNRVESDRPARDAGGGWVHRLGGGNVGAAFASSSCPIGAQALEIAPVGRRDRTYRRLIAALTLQQSERQGLLARGYAEAELGARPYRNLPLSGRARLAREASDGSPDALRGVPGFWVATGQGGCPYWSLAGRPGLLIPCLDPAGRVRALRIRHEGKGRYSWLSSGHRPGGTGSGVHCHVARPLSPLRDWRVWVVEGEIKADLSAERLGAVVVSIPGVSCWQRALADLAELLPGGGGVVVALDADWRDKPEVHRAVWGLCQVCRALGYGVEAALWEATWKGLDDLLTGGTWPEVKAFRPGVIPEPEWTAKVSSRTLAETAATERTTATLAEARRSLCERLTALGGMALST